MVLFRGIEEWISESRGVFLDVASSGERRAEMARRSDEIIDGWTYETSVRDFERAVRKASGRSA